MRPGRGPRNYTSGEIQPSLHLRNSRNSWMAGYTNGSVRRSWQRTPNAHCRCYGTRCLQHLGYPAGDMWQVEGWGQNGQRPGSIFTTIGGSATPGAYTDLTTVGRSAETTFRPKRRGGGAGATSDFVMACALGCHGWIANVYGKQEFSEKTNYRERNGHSCKADLNGRLYKQEPNPWKISMREYAGAQLNG